MNIKILTNWNYSSYNRTAVTLYNQYAQYGYNAFPVSRSKFLNDTGYHNPGNFSFADLDCNHGGLPQAHGTWQWDETVSKMFQAVRDQYGAAITVTSAFRCPVKNIDTEGGSRSSKHVYGRAFDFQQLVGGQPSTQENWDVGQAAANEAVGVLRTCILFYPYAGGQYKSLKDFEDNGWGPGNLPPGWSVINQGHIHSTLDSDTEVR
jgi:hypothetical protein